MLDASGPESSPAFEWLPRPLAACEQHEHALPLTVGPRLLAGVVSSGHFALPYRIGTQRDPRWVVIMRRDQWGASMQGLIPRKTEQRKIQGSAD